MTTLEDIQARIDQGLPAGISGVPANPEHWGIETVDVVLRKRAGNVEAFGRGLPIQLPSCEFGSPIPIAPTVNLEVALHRVEDVLLHGVQRVRQSIDEFLATTGAMLGGLTLIALTDCGDFRGIEWCSTRVGPRPVLHSSCTPVDALELWVLSLNGVRFSDAVEYEPAQLHDLRLVRERIRSIWAERCS